MSERRGAARLGDRFGRPRARSIPGIVQIGSRPSMPSATNSGYTKSDADSWVSRTSPRNWCVARSLRMRVWGKAIGLSEDTPRSGFAIIGAVNTDYAVEEPLPPEWVAHALGR